MFKKIIPLTLVWKVDSRGEGAQRGGETDAKRASALSRERRLVLEWEQW